MHSWLPVPRDRILERVMRLGAGLVLFGVSIAVMLTAELGVGSWDVLHQGLAERTGIPFGWIVNGVSIAALLLWIPIGERPGIGTIANAVVVGIVADLTLGFITKPESVFLQFGMLGVGIVGNGIATGLYIGAGLGPGPRDGLMTGLSDLTGRSIRTVRTGIEIAVLAAGWLLGGPVGLGTLLSAVTIGPLSQTFLRAFTIEDSPQPNSTSAVLRRQ
ncbi:MAG: YczE/YyaS/YitT family protein [Acidimicrobiia bacterium]